MKFRNFLLIILFIFSVSVLYGNNIKAQTNNLNETHVNVKTLSKDNVSELLQQQNAHIRRLSLAVLFFLSMVILFASYFIYTRKKTEKRWHQLSNATFEGIAIFENSVILDGNNKLEQILGCKRIDFIGKYLFDFIPQPQNQGVDFKEPSGHIVNYETQIIRPDGTTILVEVLSRPFEYKGKAVRVASLRDISIRLQAEKKLKEYADSLKELNETKDKFFSIIAHDLKNPFSGILGFSELLLKELKENNTEHVYEFTSYINESAESAYQLLENLLEWSRSQTGKLNFTPANINLNEIVKQEIALFENMAFRKKINIKHEMTQETIAYADKNLVKTIIRNLISNAVKFTDKQGEIVANINCDNNDVNICVSNTGKGMSALEIDNLFRLDVNFTTIGTEGERGTGLGLIICKEFVKLNGGKIWVESQTEKITRFCFTLPKKQLQN